MLGLSVGLVSGRFTEGTPISKGNAARFPAELGLGGIVGLSAFVASASLQSLPLSSALVASASLLGVPLQE